MEHSLSRSSLPRAPGGADKGAAAFSAVAGFGALFSAAACCILPLMLGAIGLGAGGLAAFVPFHWPLTILAMAALAGAWLLYAIKRRACARDADCAPVRPARLTLIMLCLATLFVSVSALWSFIEQPLMRSMGGA